MVQRPRRGDHRHVTTDNEHCSTCDVQQATDNVQRASRSERGEQSEARCLHACIHGIPGHKKRALRPFLRLVVEVELVFEVADVVSLR